MREQKRPLNAADVERRLQFIIDEASLPNPIYDQTVRMAFRVATNFYCVGRDCGSEYVYEFSRYRSEEANKVWRSGDWKKQLHNEHQEPLKVVWDWIINDGQVTTKRLEERLRKWPMVVITRDEERGIAKKETCPIKRYENIRVFQLADDKTWSLRVCPGSD